MKGVTCVIHKLVRCAKNVVAAWPPVPSLTILAVTMCGSLASVQRELEEGAVEDTDAS